MAEAFRQLIKTKFMDPFLVRLPPKQVQRHTGESYRQLVGSVKLLGFVHLPTVKEIEGGYEALAGVGRIMAWIESHPGEEMPALVREPGEFDAAIPGVEQLIREDWKPWEAMEYLGGLEDQGWSQKKMAEVTKLDTAVISGQLKILHDAIPELLEAYRAGNLGYSVALEIARQTLEGQLPLLHAALNGDTREQIKRKSRKPSEGPKLSRAMVPFKDGSLTISRPGLDMDAVVNVLADTLDDARKALKAHYTLKTWLAAVTDRLAKEVTS